MSRLVNASKNSTEKLYKRVGCFQRPLDFARPPEFSKIRKKFQVLNKKERSGLLSSPVLQFHYPLTCPNKIFLLLAVCTGDIFPILDKPGREKKKQVCIPLPPEVINQGPTCMQNGEKELHFLHY